MKHLILIICLALSVPFANGTEATPAGAESTAPIVAKSDFSGKVVETMTTAGYTYVLVDTGGKKLWAAAVQFAVKQGDNVSVITDMAMPNYHSKSLNRDFDMVYFAKQIDVNGGDAVAGTEAPVLPPGHPPLTTKSETAALPPGHPSLNTPSSMPDLVVTDIKRADGGQTIQEVYAAATSLSGKAVTVRGKVVKYNAEIMGKNWLHIRDGSGSSENKDNDLTVTTEDTAKVGDTVLVNGNVVTDKDFGAGYKYGVMIGDAKLTVE